MLADCYRLRINVFGRIDNYYCFRIVKTTVLIGGIVGNETIRVRYMRAKRNSIGKAIYFQNKNVIWPIFFSKNLLTMTVFFIKSVTQTAEFHGFLNKNAPKLGRQKLGFFLINVIAPYKHFTDRTFFRLTWLRSTITSCKKNMLFSCQCQENLNKSLCLSVLTKSHTPTILF